MRFRRTSTAAATAALFAINWYVVRELFSAPFIAQMGSIEATHIAIARYAAANWPDLWWFPLWYGGIPYQNTYPPLLHLTVAAVARLFACEPALAYHAVTATLYCLGPVSLFWMAYRLSGSRAYSFAAGLVYSVFSPALLLLADARHDIGSVFFPRRFQALVQYGEGPHVASMTLLPVAIVCLDAALAKRKRAYYVLAALSMAGVVLTNWLGGAALAGAVIAYLLIRFPVHSGKAWLITAAIGVFAYAIAAPWIPPSTLAAIRANAQWMGGPYTVGWGHLKYVGVMLVALALLSFWNDRRKPGVVLGFAVVFSFLVGVITLAAEWLGVFIMPQPGRYHLELEMGLALVFVFALKYPLDGMGRAARAVVLAGLLLFVFWQAKTYRTYAKYQDRRIDIQATVEYQAARWFDSNMRDQRIFAPGSVSFWLNCFTDTPQLGGGFDQGITNPLLPVMQYQVYSGSNAGSKEAEIATLWLEAYGVRAVFAGGAGSREFFKPIRNGHKFDEVLQEVWRSGDDAIFKFRQGTGSLAHVVPRAALPARAPASGLDVDPLRPYVAALEDSTLPPADFRWLDNRHARVVGILRAGQVLSVQVTYHPGWHASMDGRPQRVLRDNLGLLVIEPDREGRCTVDLTYDGGAEMLAARVISWSALLCGVVWIVAGTRAVQRRGTLIRTARGGGGSS